jgi:uncharacterized protein
MSVKRIKVKVVPGASRDEIAGWLNDELKVRVAAPPEGGKANKAVIRLLAAEFSVKNSRINIIAGKSSPHKTVEIEGI